MEIARVDFDLPAVSGPIEAPLASALAVLLYRYDGQPAVEITASSIGPDGEIAWRRLLRLATPPEARCRDILDQASRSLTRPDVETPTDGETELSRAAITFSEAGATAPHHATENLQLEIRAACRSLHASFLYDTRMFTRPVIERAAEHLNRLLRQVASDPDAPIARLPLLSADEKRLIECVCDGPPGDESPQFAHQAFEAHAAATPSATAVRFRDTALTYADLNARANALARRLIAEGVGAESPVAVCLSPSLDVPVALLATLKAGGVYVPLDPTHPEARLRALVDEVKPHAVVGHACFLDKLRVPGVPALAMNDFAAVADGFPDTNLEKVVRPEQSASIYFTSGTTGAPKGAVASHANLASYLAMARDRYAIGAGDVMPAIARFSFSISMFELMSPLTAGATLVILDRDHILDMERMSRTLEEVTIFHAGPSLLKNVVAHIRRRYAGFAPFSRVRHASSGGDMIPPELLEDLKEIFGGAEVFVIYGCTEISCMGCTYPVPRDRVIERTYVGRPFAGVSVRVLDPSMNLMPAGLVGEIWFAGDGVVKGYLGRPELTSQRFVDIDGRRCYRTGDVGRLSEDGWIEILGRSDFQVKLRGIRVELGEVEHHLRRAPGVRDAIVMPMTIGTEKALVAYVVPDGERPMDASVPPTDTIHQHMARHLPDYMLPATYVTLDRLPLNHNMKVDRAALPAPDTRRSVPQRSVRPPRTETERRLAALWTDVLGVANVGLDDRFFDMGGDSLLGLAFITQVGRDIGVDLNGLDIVRETLEGLAAICDARLGRPPSSAIVADEASTALLEPPFEAFHFGQQQELYGVLSGASVAFAQEAVLICAPLGQDHSRAHFILQRLAARLASAGVPALRFDYHGCGDSMGDSLAATCGRWRCDIQEAYRELRRRTKATRIIAVGVRLGATLLAETVRGLDVASLVVWDPVCDGASFIAESAAIHERFVGKWRRLFRPPAPIDGAVELLGWTCSPSTISEIRTLVFPPASPEPLPPVKRLDLDPGWSNLSHLDENLPDAGVSAALAKMVLERP